MRANVSSVESELGGGDHGYLGLVLTDEEYAKIVATPFVPPHYPGELAIPAETDQITALNLRERHNEHKRRYFEYKNVEKALQWHIQDAIKDKYLATLVNEDTQSIQEDIASVLTYLFDTYGKIPSEEVKQKETEIRTMSFHPADPMILLYHPIEKLKSMAQSAGIPYTANQILDIGLTVLRNTRDFERALGDWEKKPEHQKTWATFTLHFTQAQKELNAIRGPTMQQAGYHQLNLLAQQMHSSLEQNNLEMMTNIQTAMDKRSQAPILTSTAPSTLTPATQLVNATTTDMVQMEILKLLKQMQQDMKCVPATTNSTERPKRNRKTPDDSTYPRRKTDRYCWTHGACAHPSLDCQAKAPGHKDEATFHDKKGGSKAHCT